MASARTRRYRAALGAALLLGAAARAGVHGQLAAADPTFSEPFLDGRIFMDWAGRIAAGDWVGEGAYVYNPLFPHLFAPVVALAGEAALGAVRLVHALLGLGTVLLVAGATRRLLGRRAAAVAALLAALWPASLFFESVPTGATLGLFLNALALFLLARWRGRRTRGLLLGSGVALGLGILGRPNLLLFPAVLPLWLRGLFPPPGRWRRVAGAMLLLGAGTLLPLLPFLARNLSVLGEPVVTTTSMGLNLHLTNNPLAWEWGRMDSPLFPFNPFLLEEASRAVAEAEAGRPLSPTEQSTWWTRRTLRDCAADPGRAAAFAARKALYFCGAHEIPASESFEQGRRDSGLLALLAPLLSFGILLPPALLGAFTVLRRRRRALPLVLLLAVYALGLVIFIPLANYRLPVLPALIPLAAGGAVAAWGALRRPGGPLRRGSAAALLLVGALLSHGNLLAGALGVPALGPYPEPPSWMLALRAQALVDRALRRGPGEEAARERDLALADREARRALALSPAGDNGRWLVYAALARAAGARGDLEAEARFLAEGLALSPGQPHLLEDLRRNRERRAAAGPR